MDDAVIYQIFPRVFSDEGTLQAVTDRLEDIVRLGANVVYLLPIHPIGEKRRTGRLGSPYSIRDHLGVCGEIGTLLDLKALVGRAHDLGMKVLMDLVPNHSSFDNPLVARQPDWYVRDSNGVPVPPCPEWQDVAQFNYASRGLRDYMIEVACYWLETAGVDGFRIDAPHLVSIDFWLEFHEAVKSRFPNVWLLAESGEPWLMDAFDAQYDWEFQRDLRRVCAGERVRRLFETLLKQRDPNGGFTPKVRYLENHDHDRWVRTCGIRTAVPAAAALMTIPGIPLIYAGQEVGLSHRPSLFEPDTVNWKEGDPDVRTTYTKLIRLRRDLPELRIGVFLPVAVQPEGRVAVFQRHLGDQGTLVAVNLGPDAWRGRAPLDGWRVVDSIPVFGHAKLIPTPGGASIEISGYEAALWPIERSDAPWRP